MKSCLVVDDSRVVRKVARKILEELSFVCSEAEDGKQAMEACAVQMPDARDEPAQVLIREVAAQQPWAAKLADVERVPLDSVNGYYAMLKPHCRRVDVWRTTYYHAMASTRAIVDWLRATGLRPFLAALDDEAGARFIAAYERRLDEVIPRLPDGRRLLAFPRLFLVAQKRD